MWVGIWMGHGDGDKVRWRGFCEDGWRLVFVWLWICVFLWGGGVYMVVGVG